MGLFLALLAGLWELLVEILDLSRSTLPGPREVASVLVDDWPLLLRNMSQTMEAVLWGFALGSLAGFMLGVLVNYVGVAKRALYPLSAVLYVIPKSIFIPLFVLWWGVGPMHKLTVILLLVFFPVMENTIAGLRSAQADMVDLSRSLGASKVFTFRKIELPSALPFMFAGLRIGLTDAFIGAVIVELIAPFGGIGAVMTQARVMGNTNFILAGIFVIALFGLLSYGLLERFERRVTFWR